ncbi:glycosyltransferase [Dokdonia sinensis]|uniref:Glycosyltransferase n=1 Tax=Dokdonia sinensis TaxID=2479847 RepID=A0A3M0G190_9FLAO|nr:glycosyltransferase family 4 protein [Dokdonia sinensis]RMB57957.1 glycosyltransferase [Dokdonia sinensis]
MRIAQIHNKYKDVGGEDIVVKREKQLLEDAGHEVVQFFAFNEQIKNTADKLKTALGIPFNFSFKKKVQEFLEREKPDVVHIHNFLPVLSPSVFFACKALNFPVIVTLHNFRLLCVNGLLYRDKQVCEDCVSKKMAYPGIKHGCYQESSLASVFPAVSNRLHTSLGTWYDKIDKVIFLSEFSKNVFDRSHLNFAKQQVVIKPNFIADNGFSYIKEDYYLFVGRLSEEKGIRTILKAFENSRKELVVVGDGPLRREVDAASLRSPNIRCVGFQNSEQLKVRYLSAKATIFASKMYEGQPLVILESLSYGTPVICPNFGNAGLLIESNVNGMKYDLGDATSLETTIRDFENSSDVEILNKGARNSFEQQFTAHKNLELLEEIYKQAIENSNSKEN